MIISHPRQLQDFVQNDYKEFVKRNMIVNAQLLTRINRSVNPLNKMNSQNAPSSTYAPSSIIENQDGLPVRLHGKMKYAEEISTKQRRIKIATVIRAIMASIVVCLMQLQNEMLVDNEYKISQSINILKTMVTCLTTLEICIIVMFFTEKLALFKLKNDLTRQNSINLISPLNKYRRAMILDILLHLVICPPGVEIQFQLLQEGRAHILYTWDMICACIGLIRLHIFIQLVPQFSPYTSPQAKRVCHTTGAKANTQFTWKSIVKKRPYTMLACTILVSIIILGVLIRNLERSNLDRNGKLDYLWDSFWLVIITMLTVGYGDIFIFVNISRMVFMLAIAWGFLIYSLFIVSMNVLTTLTQEEKVVYDTIVHQEKVDGLKQSAGTTIAKFLVFAHRHRKRLNKEEWLKKKAECASQRQIERVRKQIQEYQCMKVYSELVFYCQIFRKERKYQISEKLDLDRVLTRMDTQIIDAHTFERLLTQTIDDADQLSQNIQNDQTDINNAHTKLKKMSNQSIKKIRLLAHKLGIQNPY
ncbi:hypothetical protein FGO68_gene2421 [Halteria grandinella]|uniref:Potassium channel domain-containing protein n=1 Tax=Halteria grandinella TaxID=5974 RepID=A0A8J8NW90_HALGN|nr:hypothetical protein FGO68_gene2421 [Halteria grandinella]